MAKTITLRTLRGYNMSKNGTNYTIKGGYKPNIHYFEDYVNQVKNKQDKIVEKVLNPKYWGKDGKENMKFDAVVGNPPYQEEIKNRGEQPPVYHNFYDLARKISNVVSLITPGRFLFDAGKTPKEWNKKMLNDEYFQVVKYIENSEEIFPQVEIKGGVVIGLINLKEKKNR